MNWFRFYSEAIDDKKLRRIARETDSSFACVLGIWAIVLSLASDSCIRGALMLGDGVAATPDDLSDIAGCNVTVTLQKLVVTGLVTDADGVLYVSSWDKRQYVSDSSAERVKSYRERQNQSKNGQNPPYVTPAQRYSNVTVTPPDTDTDTDNTADTVVSAAEPPEPPPTRDGEKPGRVPKQKPDIGALVFDPVQDYVLVELLTAHYDGTGKRPPAKFQNVAQRDGYRMAAEFLGPDTTRKAITQCIVGNRYAIGQIVTSLLRWVDNEKRGGVARQNGQQPNEPRGYAALRRVAKELFPNGV